MIEIQALCTHPDMQGRGYASALVEYVLRQVSCFVNTIFVESHVCSCSYDKGDSEGRDVWLLTTSAYGFYEHFGFVTVRSGRIGVDNPAWDGEPITLNIVRSS